MEPNGEVNWLLAFILTNFVTIVGAVFAWVRAIKMTPKEVKGAELDNKNKEVSLAEQFNNLAIKAAEQTVFAQSRLEKIEKDYNILKEAHDSLVAKVAEQGIILKDQARTIETQNLRINQQDIKINEQEELIACLRSDLDASTEYNNMLIAQMKERNITPVQSTKHRKTNGKSLDSMLSDTPALEQSKNGQPPSEK